MHGTIRGGGLGKKKKTTKSKQKPLNMTHTKDILPPHLKYNVIITEFTTVEGKGKFTTHSME